LRATSLEQQQGTLARKYEMNLLDKIEANLNAMRITLEKLKRLEAESNQREEKSIRRYYHKYQFERRVHLKPIRNLFIQKDAVIIDPGYKYLYSNNINKIYIRKGINRFENSHRLYKKLIGNVH
jgi:hypothetical protein